MESQTNVVYKIPCTSCSWCYIGKTDSRELLIPEKKEHLRNTKTAAKGSNHAWSNNHAIDFENASIIDKGTFRTRKTLEAWHTKVTPNADNNSCPLPAQSCTTFFLTNIRNYLHFYFISQLALFSQIFSSLSYHSFYPSKTAVRAVESS